MIAISSPMFGLDVKMNMNTEELEKYITTVLAEMFANWLTEKSKKGFYAGLARSVDSEGNDITGEGLLKYIMDERPELFEEFLETLNE